MTDRNRILEAYDDGYRSGVRAVIESVNTKGMYVRASALSSYFGNSDEYNRGVYFGAEEVRFRTVVEFEEYLS